MSKKKERRIKRLQRLPIWPAVLEMILTELVIFILTIFICAISVFGILNTLILNMAKDCNTVIQSVNENWSKESREQIESRLSAFTESFSDINEIFIEDKNNILSLFPYLDAEFDEEAKRQFDAIGMIHFIDTEYKTPLENLADSENSVIDVDLHRGSDDTVRLGYRVGMEVKGFLFNPRNMYRSMDIERLLKDRRYIEWANKDSVKLHAISVYKTEIPNITLCFRITYRLNTFQINLISTVFIFLLVVFVFSGVYEISKVVNLVHERKRVNKLVTTDIVTGGYNKEYFTQKAQKEIARSKRNYVIVQLRLEKYRNYCTAYGIKQGENLLEELNFNLVQMLTKKEIVAHVEKSDFALLLNYQNPETLNIRVKNMMNILRERQGGQHLTFSAGVCPVKNKSGDINFTLTCAGIAIPKQLKMQDEIVWFDDSMKEEQVWERRIEDDMEKALENHEFQVYLQPKYSTKNEVLAAAEALVRWIHPVLGFISPGKFIPIFEKNGFILQLDDYMLSEVARLQAEWLEQGKKLVPISVNVSRAHFAEDNLAEHICSIVDKFSVPHEFIELELTESAFFDDKSVLLTTVRKLKDFGFKVSMDDFGAGYSSLNSLKELPLDIIKLDAEFFRSVDDISRSNLIVGETISLAKKLGMEIVAEGIETREQVDFLAKQNCDLIQGFYFSKPLPIVEFEQKAWS